MSGADDLDEMLGAFENALQDATEHLVLVTGQDANDMPFWAFVRMTARSWQQFQSERETGGDLADYGSIVTSGSGKHPPRRIVEKMTKLYGYKPSSG